jgi:predicted PurR-regulated permease PerM
MEVAIITLSITLFFCIIFLGVIVKKYTDLLQKLNETVSNINKEKEKLDKLVEIEPGDSAMADEQKPSTSKPTPPPSQLIKEGQDPRIKPQTQTPIPQTKPEKK